MSGIKRWEYNIYIPVSGIKCWKYNIYISVSGIKRWEYNIYISVSGIKCWEYNIYTFQFLGLNVGNVTVRMTRDVGILLKI